MPKAVQPSVFKQVRILLWLLVALAVVGAAMVVMLRRTRGSAQQQNVASSAKFGGPFTLIGADAKPFSSEQLRGKPYAIYFGFTRCGDVCPTTLARLVKLRQESGSDHAMNIVFVTIDPANDGPKEVGQYAELFGAPIVGLTGSQAQIDRVKRQYGIYAEPSPHPMPGKEMMHTATVLLFDRSNEYAATISPDEPDVAALAKIKRLVG